MAQGSRTFRVFVSSTFSDLKAERNALAKHVFPKLRKLCARHGCRFQAVDLRWGVREEAALDQQTMRICLDELRRCQRTTPRPNFIVLLGDRYGWRPPPSYIPAAEYQQIVQHVSATADRELLDQWYRRDDNAVPPEYVLQPRAGQHEDYAQWEPIERQLWTILRDAQRNVALSPRDRLRYEASATAQEVFHGALDESLKKEHVFCFFRKIENLPELVRALPHQLAAKEYVDRTADGSWDEAAHAELETLKRGLRDHLGAANVADYSARWDGPCLTGDHIGELRENVAESPATATTLCEAVWQTLSRVIEEEVAGLEQVEPLERERQAHAAFGKDRARVFLGRTTELERIRAYLRGDSRQPLVLWGASGSGKSALMAKAALELQQSPIPNPIPGT